MKEMNQSSNLRHLFYPRCPYNDSVIVLIFRIGIITFGTIGLSFLNVWVAVVYLLYSVVYNALIWPIIHCQYCYYKIREPTIEIGKTVLKLLPIDDWKESYLPKHVACGKKWGSPNIMLLWFAPIVLISISFFLNFSPFAVVALIGFLIVLVANGIYIRRKVCTNCAFMEECHSSF